jgi:hypothetical protein
MSEPQVAKVIVTSEILERVKETMHEGVTDEEAMHFINDTIQDYVDSDTFNEDVFNHQN